MEPVKKGKIHDFVKEMLKENSLDAVEEFVTVINKELEHTNYSVINLSSGEKDDFSVAQKARMTKAVFENEEVLRQLRQARANRDSDLSSYSDDEEDFDRLVDEVNLDAK
ncbi:hypothetical protein [Halalkalibacter nanhaiisediminis]|uniref:Uncharacterized protein n=1 Tax=Halalkalibacter nanhaiisediminis TaxID=688079 RepID=A0A562QI51_9BACI|nr:hypothetical protein [Halalkalibacter nanhaiisediminis]TWI56343.1 hypothetical protein IQ10_02237 [Halalkalibacter nanhaiisediminis]